MAQSLLKHRDVTKPYPMLGNANRFDAPNWGINDSSRRIRTNETKIARRREDCG